MGVEMRKRCCCFEQWRRRVESSSFAFFLFRPPLAFCLLSNPNSELHELAPQDELVAARIKGEEFDFESSPSRRKGRDACSLKKRKSKQTRHRSPRPTERACCCYNNQKSLCAFPTKLTGSCAMASPSASASRKNTTLTALVLILGEVIPAFSLRNWKGEKRESEGRNRFSSSTFLLSFDLLCLVSQSFPLRPETRIAERLQMIVLQIALLIRLPTTRRPREKEKKRLPLAESPSSFLLLLLLLLRCSLWAVDQAKKG